MKQKSKLLIFLAVITLALTLSACASSSLAEYDKAAAKTMEETAYRETISMSASASLEGETIRVSLVTDLDCLGNTGATYRAVGIGRSTVSGGSLEEDLVSPFKVYLKDGKYYYDYENYFEDGSNYQYCFSAEYKAEDYICDLIPVTAADIEEATSEETAGGKTVTLTIKNDRIDALMMNTAILPLNTMLFGEDYYTLDYYDLSIMTTIGEDGRVIQSTATVSGYGDYYGSSIAIVYVYDLSYRDFGAELDLLFPEGLDRFENLD